MIEPYQAGPTEAGSGDALNETRGDVMSDGTGGGLSVVLGARGRSDDHWLSGC